MLILEATKKNEGKERSQIEGIVEDATDNEHERNPEAQSSMPLGLTNTDAIFQMENLREKSNPEAWENWSVGAISAEEAQNQLSVDIHLDPRMPGTPEKEGDAEDTIAIFLLMLMTPSKSWKLANSWKRKWEINSLLF